jgi:hypothetical protein
MSYLFSNRNANYNHTDDRLQATVVAANKYIPTYVAGYLGSAESMYYKRDLDHCFRKPNSIRNITQALMNSLRPTKISMYDTDFYVLKGTILDSAGKPLLMAAYDKDKWLAGPGDGQLKPILFYSSTFFTDSKLAPLNRRLQKEILIDCYEKGMEVRVLSPSIIEANTFAELFEVKKTETLLGLDSYMKTILPNILHTQEEDTFVEATGNQEELLSVEEEALLYDSNSTITISGSAHTELIYNPPLPSYQMGIQTISSSSTTGGSLVINASEVPNVFANYPTDRIVTSYGSAALGGSVGILQQMEENDINVYSGNVSLADVYDFVRPVTPTRSTIELVDDTE